MTDNTNALTLAAYRLRTAMTRGVEVEEYAAKHGLTTAEAIIDLVNSGLSHDYPRTTPRVYVMSFEHEGVGYTSVHGTYKGAEDKLVEKVGEFGFADLLGTDNLKYGISYLEIEE